MSINVNERDYLRNNIRGLLAEYDYNYTDEAINDVIDEWEYNKTPLIEAFKKHPNYLDGKFMIAFDCDYERAVNPAAISNFMTWLINECVAPMCTTIPQEIIQRREAEWCDYLPKDIFDYLYYLGRGTTSTISKETEEIINKDLAPLKVREGQKTNKVINKICNFLGYDKHPDYNREYAKFADALNPLKIKRHTVISINPLDYLTMSFGNSWASCHTIDKNNKRGMPDHYSGCYSSGTVSYMLDPSSIVLYTVDAAYDGNEYWTQPKINRQMFHWGQEKLVQGRLYPQCNDGCGDVYRPYRNIMQEVISTIFDFPNLWDVKRGVSAACEYIESYGTHYKDYRNYDSCTISRIRGSDNQNYLVVGHKPICFKCGESHDIEKSIVCDCDIYRCSRCGEELNEDSVIWIDDEPYCRDCCHYCDYCDTYHRMGNTYVDSVDMYVCDECLDEYFSRCDACGEYVRDRDVCYTDDNRALCEDCYNELTGEDEE